MITQPTVFILGAGASVPYGFGKGEILNKNSLLNHKIRCDELDLDGKLDCLSYLKEYTNHIK